MMNKTLIAVVIVLLVLLGIGAYAFSTKSSDLSIMDNSAENISEETMNLESLMKLTGSQTCTFTETNTGSTGVVYVGEGKARSDFSFKSDDKTQTAHMIHDGVYVYTWFDGETNGFKASLEDLGKVTENIPTTASTNQVDTKSAVDYDCSEWSVDNSKFTPPVGIKFTDYSEMMKNAESMIEENNDSMELGTPEQCSACENLPAGAKEQCLQGLGC